MTASTTDIKAPSIYSSLLTFKLNHRLFLNCLVGITNQQATERISEHNNPFIWVATHTVWARYNIIGLLNAQVENPYKGMFEGFKPFENTMVFATVEMLATEWKKASELLKEALYSVSEERLAADAPFKNPTGDFSVGGTIIFLAQHESYSIGQLALLKKHITKEAMSYN